MYLLILMVLHNTKVFSTLNFNFTLLYFTYCNNNVRITSYKSLTDPIIMSFFLNNFYIVITLT